jgi:sodium-dependent dicarboxylate transporter 2/3/5
VATDSDTTQGSTNPPGGLPTPPQDVYLAEKKTRKRLDINWKRLCFMMLGVGLFFLVYLSPPWPAAVDPQGQVFELTQQGKAALGLFLLAATWWVFEVVPIGVTSMLIGATQALFLIRPHKYVIPAETVQTIGGRATVDAEALGQYLESNPGALEVIRGTWIAFTDFLAPSVWFIFGSIMFGLCFSQTGLAKRTAYKMLAIVGERTSMILLGCFIMTSALTHVMAHTAVAAAVFPLMMAIYALYAGDDDKPTKFGKNLFIGMAYVAGAGSICTLLGAARGAVALGFYTEIVGREISFFELSYYMFPVGWVMTFVLWGYMMVALKPEQRTIPGLKERAKALYMKLGPMTGNEKLTLLIVVAAIATMSVQRYVPALEPINKSAIILTTCVLLFVLKILSVKDLEAVPWNIILLFGGAMSIGYCLWQTGAAEWMAINWLVLFQNAPWFVFVFGMALFVLVMTNVIMNVAAIAISLPVALVIAPYLGVAPEVIVFSSLVVAGMPFLLLVGAAPNAIAYESKQFTAAEFFLYGLPASVLLMLVLAVFVHFIWPAMGMPVVLPE